METALIIIHTLSSIMIVGLVLLQHGKGADVGASFGGGSAGSVFGSAGSANFLSRTTAIMATIFFVNSLALTYLHSHRGNVKESTIMKGYVAKPAEKQKDQVVPSPDSSAGAGTSKENNTESKVRDIPK